MRSSGSKPTTAVMVGILFFVAGCDDRAAPSLTLFGAYFPGWLLCGVLGAIAAVATRVLLVVTGLSPAVPAQLLFCVAVGVIVASLGWLWLGQ